MAVFNHLSFFQHKFARDTMKFPVLCAITHLLIPTQQLDISALSHAVYGAALWALFKELEPSVCKILLGHP